MSDSIEEMLDITMQTINYIMNYATTENALKSDAYKLINAAILLMDENIEEKYSKTALKRWENLKTWAIALYSTSLIMPNGEVKEKQFNASEQLIKNILLCKKRAEEIRKPI